MRCVFRKSCIWISCLKSKIDRQNRYGCSHSEIVYIKSTIDSKNPRLILIFIDTISEKVLLCIVSILNPVSERNFHRYDFRKRPPVYSFSSESGFESNFHIHKIGNHRIIPIVACICLGPLSDQYSCEQ